MRESDYFEDDVKDHGDLHTPQQKAKQQRQLDIRRGIEDYLDRKQLAELDDWFDEKWD